MVWASCQYFYVHQSKIWERGRQAVCLSGHQDIRRLVGTNENVDHMVKTLKGFIKVCSIVCSVCPLADFLCADFSQLDPMRHYLLIFFLDFLYLNLDF